MTAKLLPLSAALLFALSGSALAAEELGEPAAQRADSAQELPAAKGKKKSTKSSSSKSKPKSKPSSKPQGKPAAKPTPKPKPTPQSKPAQRPNNSRPQSQPSTLPQRGNVPPSGSSGSYAMPSSGSQGYMPGNSGDASADRPSRDSGITVTPGRPGRPDARPGVDTRPGTRPDPGLGDSGSVGSGLPSRPGSSTRPDTSGRPDRVVPETGGAPDGSRRPGDSADRPSSGSAHGNTQGGSRRPDSDNGSGRDTRPSTNAATAPGSRGGSSSRPSTSGSRPSSSGDSATRPSTGGGSSATRPSTGGGSSATRPSTGGGSHSRPSTGGHSRPSSSHSRPSTHSRPQDHRRPHSVHPRRPYTPVHRWYNGHARPIYSHRTHRPVYWYHGVWVYGPYPHHHHRYQSTTVVTGGSAEPRPELPTRKVNRNDAFSVGLTGGSYLSGYDMGGGFNDGGMGLTVRYRPVETVGFEFAYSYYDQSWDTDTARQTATLQPSIQLFAVPWTRVSPYLSMGVTATRRSYDDTWSDGQSAFTTQWQGTAVGPHAGLGLELALGEHVALDLEGRYIGYTNVGGQDPNIAGALQGIGGVQFYF